MRKWWISAALLAAAVAALELAAAPAVRAQEAQSGAGGPELFEKPPPPEPTEGRKYYSLGLRGGVWGGFFNGTLRYPVTFSSGPLATTGKFSGDVRDEEVLPYAEIFGVAKYVAIYADFWYGRFHDQTNASADFTFKGVTFSGATPVRTTLKTITAGGRLQLNPIAFDFMELGLSVGARYMNAEGTISGEEPVTRTHISETRRIEAPLPQVGASLTFFVGRMLDIYVRGRGIAFTYSDYRVRHVEGEAGLAFNFGDHVALGAEFRLFFLEIDDRRPDPTGRDRANLDARLMGPLVYLRLRF